MQCVKNEKGKVKNKETKTEFCLFISQDWLEQLASNLVSRFTCLAGISAANLVEFRVEILELHT